MNSKVDRLSSLPEEVHSHILSLMPTKFAVRTSILSKSWRYKWTFVTNLDFDDSHSFHDSKCFIKFVDRVLKLYKSPEVKLFRYSSSEMWVPNSKVSKWIDVAVKLNLFELDAQAILLEMPLSLFTCKTLTKLKLAHNTRHWDVWECPSTTTVNLPCLKTLDIYVITNPFINAFKLIPGCPVLESLSLEVTDCKGEEDYIFNIPTLKRLELRRRKGRSANVVLHVPNLEYLFVGVVYGSLFVMEDMPSLVEASVSFDHTTVDHGRVEFLKRMSSVKSLTIRNFLSASPLPIFMNMKHLELNWFDDYSELLTQFLESSPELEHLFIDEPRGSHWTEPKLVPACMRTNLTTIKIVCHKFKTCDVQLIEYILANAKVLKTLTITLGYYLTMDEELSVCAQLYKISKASRFCEIHILGRWSHSNTINCAMG